MYLYVLIYLDGQRVYVCTQRTAFNLFNFWIILWWYHILKRRRLRRARQSAGGCDGRAKARLRGATPRLRSGAEDGRNPCPKGGGQQELPHVRDQGQQQRVPDCGSAGTAESSYPTSEVRGHSREEIPHALKPEARGSGWEEQPHTVAVRA